MRRAISLITVALAAAAGSAALMAVAPEMRGLGIGRRILEHAIAEAKRIGAKSLFLGSNKRLESAVHLYESVGFRHVPAEELPDMPYVRANVFMQLPL